MRRTLKRSEERQWKVTGGGTGDGDGKGKKKGEGRFSKSDGTVRGGGVTSQ